jgi:hypothetical protein
VLLTGVISCSVMNIGLYVSVFESFMSKLFLLFVYTVFF